MSREHGTGLRNSAAALGNRPAAVGAWRAPAVIALLTAAVGALYWPTVRSLSLLWGDIGELGYTHGYLIAALSAWLLLRARSDLQALPTAWSAGAAVMLAVLSMLWLVTFRAGIEIAHQMLLPPLAACAVWTALGWRAARRCAFAFGYLYFAIPLWDLGNAILQHLTVGAIRVMLAVAGFSAYIVDNLVLIPSGGFEIAGGCSGLHFFIVALSIAALYGELQRDNVAMRILQMSIAAALAILTNWVRVFYIIVAGYRTDMRHPLISEGHYYFGWQVFAVMLVVFFLVMRYLPATAAQGRQHAVEADSLRASLAGVPVALAVAALGPAWAAAIPSAGTAHDVLLPARVSAWRGEQRDSTDWQPRFDGADVAGVMRYRHGAHAIEAYTAAYFEQRQGKELIGYRNSIVGDTLQTQGERRIEVDGAAFNEAQVRDRNGADSLLWYYYEVGNKRGTRGLSTQLLYGFMSLASAPAARVVAMRTACLPDCDAARARLTEFARLFDTAAAAKRPDNDRKES